MSKRIDWIDRAKGIGIILVILGHSIFPKMLKVVLYSFHMPLFFFLSGYVYNMKKYKTFNEFILNKIKTILIPAFSFEVITTLWSVFINYINGNNVEIKISSSILGIFIQRRGGEFSFGAWFLICLFISEIILWFILSKKFTDKTLIIIATIMSFVGYLYCRLIGVVLPWAIEVTLNAVPFLIVGYLVKKNIDTLNRYLSKKYIIFYGILNVSACFLNYYLTDTKVDMYANKYGNYFLYIIASLTGVFFIIILVKYFFIFKELNYIGKNSLIYYCLHGSIIRELESFNINVLENSYIQIIEGLIYVLINCIILHFISLIIQKKAPFILGKFN